jgi:hypothetical protein
MGEEMTTQDQQASDMRRPPVVPQDLINARIGSKNTIYAAIKSGEIESFRLGGKIIIKPEWVSKNLGW